MNKKYFVKLAKNTNILDAFNACLYRLLNMPGLGFFSGAEMEVGFVLVGNKLFQLQVRFKEDMTRRRCTNKKPYINNYVIEPYFRIVDCPACWQSQRWEEYWRNAGTSGYEHNGHEPGGPYGKPATNKWLKSRGLPLNASHHYFATRGVKRITGVRLVNLSNAGAVPRRGSDVGTSHLLAVSESGDK